MAPPPSTSVPGLAKLTTPAMAVPVTRAAALTAATTTSSPAAAARAMSSSVSFPVTASRSARIALSPARARSVSARMRDHPPASDSRQPVLPQRQMAAGSSVTRTWPMSPAAPLSPRCSRPSVTSPLLMPVATFT